MEEILARLKDISLADMQNQERGMCRGLTQQALAVLREARLRAQKLSGVLLARGARPPQSAHGGAVGQGECERAAHKCSEAGSRVVLAGANRRALELLQKSAKVCEDGVQVLHDGAVQNTQLQTNAITLRTWRLLELGAP